MSCHFLLQGTFQTQESNPRLLHWQAGSLPLPSRGKPFAGKVTGKVTFTDFEDYNVDNFFGGSLFNLTQTYTIKWTPWAETILFRISYL